MVVPFVEKVKYLGIYINSRTNNVDPSAALRKFFSSLTTSCLFWAITDELLAVSFIGNLLPSSVTVRL